MIWTFCDGDNNRRAIITWNLGKVLRNEISVLDNWEVFWEQVGNQQVLLYLIDAGPEYRDKVMELISGNHNVLFVSDPDQIEGIPHIHYFPRREGIDMLKKRVKEKLLSKR